MTEPRKVWVVMEIDEPSARQLAGNDPGSGPLRAWWISVHRFRDCVSAALARKPEEEPWEGWEDCTREVTPEMGINTRHVLVIPLPEEKP